MKNQVSYYNERIIRQFLEEVFLKLGLQNKDAKITADVLIEAEYRGYSCHGLARLFYYVERLKNNMIDPNSLITIDWNTDTTGICDGNNGLGMVVGYKAMTECIKKAKQHGTAFLTVRKSNHFGIAGYYSSIALKHNMIGITMTNASPRVVPTGGSTGKIGTNPISFSIPRKNGVPYVLDMSTSSVSSGKIDVYLRAGKKVPNGWIYSDREPHLDKNGVAPMSVLQLPLGGHSLTSGYKGYGLGMLVDILCGVLSGANFGSKLTSSKTLDQEANIGHFFGALQLSGFRDIGLFFNDLESFIEDIKSSPLDKDTQMIQIPGEPEFYSTNNLQKKGIPIISSVFKKIRQIDKELNINKLL